MTKSARSSATIEDAIPVFSSEERVVAANAIVKKNMYCAIGAGCVPVPLADLVGVTTFQVVMIKQLSNLYGVKFSEHVARNLVVALLGTLSTRLITAGVVGSIFKFIPGFGAVLGGLLAVPAVAGAVTYAVGKVFVKHFEEGGTLLDLNVEKVRSFFAEQYKSGSKAAASAEPVSA